MLMSSSPAVTFINAQINGVASTLRILGPRIEALGAAAQPGDRVIDLNGDRLLPGLIKRILYVESAYLKEITSQVHKKN